MPTPTATIVIGTIGTQTANTPFAVAGTYALSSGTWNEQLSYEDDNGALVSISTAPVTLNQVSFSYIHPGLAVGTHTVSVKDQYTGTVVQSNLFTVTAAETIVANVPTGVVAGQSYTFSGTLTGFTTVPVLTYRLDGGAATGLAGVTTTGWSTTLTAPAAGSHTLLVVDGSVSAAPVTFTVSPATVAHAISITPVAPYPTAGAAFTFSGLLTGYTSPPALTYSINAGTPVAITGVTATSWSMTITAPAVAGSYNLAVTDGTTSNSITFTVLAPAKVITPLAPSTPTAGVPFTFTGAMSGYTTVPALTYAVNGGAKTTLTGVTTTGWAASITLAAAGSTTIVVSDGTVSGSVTFTVSAATTAVRQWFNTYGMDGSFWVQPFQSTANWITSGAMVTALRNGNASTPTGHVNVGSSYAYPFYQGKSTDPTVTVTNGTHSIVVHVPLGAVPSGPAGADGVMGGVDETQPYLVWSIYQASISPAGTGQAGTGAVVASGSVITGTDLTVMDGSGLMMVDAVTGNPGYANAIGTVTGYDLAQLNANPNYVMPHMLQYLLDPAYQVSSVGPIWPLQVIDNSATNVGPIPQGCTIGIPVTTKRPTGQTRGFYAWFDCLQQFGAFFYNVASSGGTTFNIYDETGLYGTLSADMVSQISAVMQYVCILNYDSTVTGSQYSLATTKGAVPGSINSFPAPPPLDLSPTGGKNVAPSTFGAWYPSGYNAIPTNSTTAATYTISPTTPTAVVAGASFTFSGTLVGYSAAPTLTYSVNGGAAATLGGVTSTGWSTTLTIAAAGTTTITVTDAAHGISGSCNFNATATKPTTSPVTWNSAAIGGAITLSNNNYTATAGGSTTPYAAPAGVLATSPVAASGVILWEVTFAAITQDCAVGVANTTASLTSNLGGDTNGIGFYPSSGTGSQPAQTVYFGGNQLTSGNGVTSGGGAVVTIAINGDNAYFSDAAMRSTSGVSWNGSTTADPVANVGGFNFTGIGSTFYPIFQTAEGGAIAVLNDGTSAFGAFAAAYIAANPSVLTLSGQTTVAGKTITPNQPTGVVAGAPFTFTGTLTGYTAAPNLTYSIDGASYAALSGVTATGWSATLTSSTTGSNTITVTDGTVSGTTTFTVSAVGSGGTTGTRVTAPLTGTVTTGTWDLGLQLTSFKNGPSGLPMQYSVLLPANYSTSLIYPVLVFGHEDYEGMNGSTYPLDATSLIINDTALGSVSINNVFNTVAWRTANPFIVVIPQCDQTLGDTNGNGNFGGYDDTPNSGWNEQAINALLAHILSTYSADPTRCYCGGCSLGGIGALAWCVDNNAYNGVNKLWAAGFSLSDELYRPAVNGGSNSAAFSTMQGVPFFAFPTTSDNDPTSYDLPAWQYYTGNTNYPGPSNYASGGAAACRAGSTSYYLMNDGGNSPTPTYLLMKADGGLGDALWSWLSSQIASGSASPTITGVTFTPAATVVAASVSGTVAGSLAAGASNGALSGISYALNTTTNFQISGTSIVFASSTVAAGVYPLTVTVTATNATNSPQSYSILITVASTAVATRRYQDQPGTNANVWNTPIGSGATYGAPTDADTIAARNGGAINTTSNYGAVLWDATSSTTNTTVTFTGNGGNYANPAYAGTGQPFTLTAACVVGSYAPGPYPGDNQYSFIDEINSPGNYNQFGPLAIQSLQPGTGTQAAYFGGIENAMSDTFAQDWETGNANFVQAAGLIRSYDLDPTRNAARIPGTSLTRIQHVLRYAHDPLYLKANANPDTTANPDYPNGFLLPNSWPQLYQDYQSNNNIYTGALVYGTQLFIPMTTAFPSSLAGNAAAQQIFDCLQRYGSITRDAASGGYHLYADQNVSATWISEANAALPTLVQLLVPMRNQHQGGQSFTTNPINGPGTRLDSGPPPLAPIGGAVGAGTFTVSGGQVIAPNGQPFIARGINVMDADMANASSNAANQPLTSLFPGINIVRLACYSYQPPSYYQTFVNQMTAAGIVVEFENHQTSTGSNGGGASGVVFTTANGLLAPESKWYAALAAAFAGNPYVWFGTNNEPSYNPSLAALSTWQQATYNAIRGAGANNIIMICLPGGGNPGTYGAGNGLTASVYAPMTNVIWDFHQYPWLFNDSNGNNGQTGPNPIAQATIQSQMLTNIAEAQTITSANGIIPVICGETGNSTTGGTLDVSAYQMLAAVNALSTGASGHLVGFMAWLWGSYGNYDDLTNAAENALTTPYGTTIGGYI